MLIVADAFISYVAHFTLQPNWCWWWCSAADNVVKADEIRTLVKDIWDTRMAKLRSSIDDFLKSDAAHAKVYYSVQLSATGGYGR